MHISLLKTSPCHAATKMSTMLRSPLPTYLINETKNHVCWESLWSYPHTSDFWVWPHNNGSRVYNTNLLRGKEPRQLMRTYQLESVLDSMKTPLFCLSLFVNILQEHPQLSIF